MRTTVSIDDEVLAAAKEAARRRGTTLSEVVEQALRRALDETAVAGAPELPTFRGGTGPRPGVPLRSNRGLLDLREGADAATES